MHQFAWNFQGLPVNEVEPCYLYEYAKESPAIHDAVAQYLTKKAYADSMHAKKRTAEWFAANPEPTEDAEHQAWAEKLRLEIGDTIATTKLRPEIHFVLNLAAEGFFPARHWLEIDPGVRRGYDLPPDRERRGLLDLDPATMATRRLYIQTLEEFRESCEQFPLFLVQVDGKSGPHVFDLWWARSDKKLLEDFAEWLKNNRPKNQQPFHASPKGGGRRTTERDLLKALGAFRLMKAFGSDYIKAREHTQDVLPRPLYGDQSAWIKAATRAEAHIGQFQDQHLRS